MAEEAQPDQSRSPLVAALILGAAIAVAALIGWYYYLAESETSRTLASENAAYLEHIRLLEDRIGALETQTRTVAESLAQSNLKTGELETTAQQLAAAKTTLETDLAREQQTRQQVESALAGERQTREQIAQALVDERLTRQQVEDALAGERQALGGMRRELAGLKSNYVELEQQLAQQRTAQTELGDQIDAADAEKRQLLERLEQAGRNREQLARELAQVSGEVEAKQAELAASRQSMEQLDQDLAQTRTERRQLETRVEELSEQRQAEARDFADLKQRLESELKESRVRIAHLKNRMTVISLTSEVLFNSGSAVIKPAGREVLSLIGSTLGAYPDRIVSIEGHTDNVPLAKGAFYRSNWQLSAERALAAVDYLRGRKLVSPARLRVVGYGEFRPVASNETEAGRQLNRRIEIRLLPPGWVDGQPDQS